MQLNFTLNLKKHDKTATYKKSPAKSRGRGITNKIFNMAKLLQKLFSCKRKAKKVQDTELQVINGYLCYKNRRYSELNYEQREQYNDCLALHILQELLKKSQLRYVLK